MLVGVVSAVMAVATAALLHPAALLVLLAGMVVSAAYSLRPVRLADRGAVASLVLPACYVGVPYLVGLLAASGGISAADMTLLAGLYVGFIGRILLKDFRDLRGDALFGKRTFLVRHGRAWTCLFSAVCWIAGTVTVVAALGEPPAVLLIAYGVALLAVLAPSPRVGNLRRATPRRGDHQCHRDHRARYGGCAAGAPVHDRQPVVATCVRARRGGARPRHRGSGLGDGHRWSEHATYGATPFGPSEHERHEVRG